MRTCSICIALIASILLIAALPPAIADDTAHPAVTLAEQESSFFEMLDRLRELEDALPSEAANIEDRARIDNLEANLTDIGLSLAADAIEEDDDALARRVLARLLTRSADERILAMIQVSFGRPLQGIPEQQPVIIERESRPIIDRSGEDRRLERMISVIDSRLRQIERDINNNNFAETRIERLENQVRGIEADLTRAVRRIERLDLEVQRQR